MIFITIIIYLNKTLFSSSLISGLSISSTATVKNTLSSRWAHRTVGTWLLFNNLFDNDDNDDDYLI